MSDNNNYTSPASSNKPQEDTNNHKPIGSSSKSFRSLACQRIGCLMSSNALKQQQPRLGSKSSSKNSLMGVTSLKDTNNHKITSNGLSSKTSNSLACQKIGCLMSSNALQRPTFP